MGKKKPAEDAAAADRKQFAAIVAVYRERETLLRNLSRVASAINVLKCSYVNDIFEDGKAKRGDAVFSYPGGVLLDEAKRLREHLERTEMELSVLRVAQFFRFNITTGPNDEIALAE